PGGSGTGERDGAGCGRAALHRGRADRQLDGPERTAVGVEHAGRRGERLYGNSAAWIGTLREVGPAVGGLVRARQPEGHQAAVEDCARYVAVYGPVVPLRGRIGAVVAHRYGLRRVPRRERGRGGPFQRLPVPRIGRHLLAADGGAAGGVGARVV